MERGWYKVYSVEEVVQVIPGEWHWRRAIPLGYILSFFAGRLDEIQIFMKIGSRNSVLGYELGAQA